MLAKINKFGDLVTADSKMYNQNGDYLVLMTTRPEWIENKKINKSYRGVTVWVNYFWEIKKVWGWGVQINLSGITIFDKKNKEMLGNFLEYDGKDFSFFNSLSFSYYLLKAIEREDVRFIEIDSQFLHFASNKKIKQKVIKNLYFLMSIGYLKEEYILAKFSEYDFLKQFQVLWDEKIKYV